jgi:hypothetical protein
VHRIAEGRGRRLFYTGDVLDGTVGSIVGGFGYITEIDKSQQLFSKNFED